MSNLGSNLTGVRVPTLQARASAASETGAEGSGSAQSNFKPLLFLFTVLLAWVSLAPFKDRGNAAMLETLVSGSIANRVVYPALLLSLLFSIGLQNRSYLGILMRAGCIPLLAWLVVTTLTSLDPLLSARRVSLFAIHMSIAYMAMLLPRNQNELARLYAIACSIVLILCYVGVALLPHLSIHQLTDVLETDLAGNWRGLFDHKNQAASVMVMFVFVGLFVARVFNPVIGWTISALSAVFLVFTVSKTSIILLPVSLMIAAAVERCRKPSSRALAAVLLLAVFNTLTIGASFPGPIRSVLQRTMPDASFTGRTDLWRFAIGSIAERPLVGYGVGAFWRTDATMHRDCETAEPEDISGWAELQRDRLEERHAKHIFHQPAHHRFYNEFAAAGMNSGSCALTALELDGEIVAGLLAIADKPRLTLVRIANRGGSLARLGLGRLLIESTLSAMHVDGFTHFDFSIGDGPHKKRFAAEPSPLVDLYAYVSWRGRAYARAQQAKSLIRQVPGAQRLIRSLARGSAPAA